MLSSCMSLLINEFWCRWGERTASISVRHRFMIIITVPKSNFLWLQDKQWDSYGKYQSITFCKIQLIHPPYSAGVPQPHKRESDTFYDLRQGGKEGGGGTWNLLEKLCTRLQKAAWEETFMEIKPDGVIRLNHCELINVYGWLIERFEAVTSRGLWSSHRTSEYTSVHYSITPKPTAAPPGWTLSDVGFALRLKHRLNNHSTLGDSLLAWDLAFFMKADQ